METTERPPSIPKIRLETLPFGGSKTGVLLDLPAPETGGGWTVSRAASRRESEMRFTGDAFEQGFKAAIALVNDCLDAMREKADGE